MFEHLHMFQHLYRGSAPWLLLLVELGVVVHISAGGVGIVSGATALAARKGERLHRMAGSVFFAAMLTMSTMAATLASIAVSRGHAEQWGNVFGGGFAFYLAATAWATVRRKPGTIGRFEIGAFIVAALVSVLVLNMFIQMALGRAPQNDGVPIAAPIIFAGVAFLCAGTDLKVILHHGITGAPRIARHLWRMCVSLFVATGSFFLGQQKDMPAFMQGSPVLIVLGVAPLVLMVFWLFRVRLTKTFREPAVATAAPA